MFNFLHALEYVSKGSFVPELQVLLEVFKALLESVHAGPMIYFCLGPPGLCELMEIRVREPKFLKTEGFEFGSVPCVQTERNGPVIRACFW
jgi:hypothetical protein